MVTHRRTTRPGADPMAAGRARDLLDRADALLDNAVGVEDEAERFRQFYLAALRGAGAALALHEPRVRRAVRGRPSDAWGRLELTAPELAGQAAFFAGLSRLRMNIEAGIERSVPPGLVAEMHRRLQLFLDAVEALIIAGERGDRAGGATVVAHPA
ncbi:MAG: SAV_6107 family HEPN domain-containing protein [Gordonia sp. (in: high G+C Gram-positive bacteria)]